MGFGFQGIGFRVLGFITWESCGFRVSGYRV